MKLEEYLGSLPREIMSGDGVQMSDAAYRDAFRLAGLGAGDVFYHLGCGDGRGVRIAAAEFGAGRAVGVDIDPAKIAAARAAGGGEFVCADAADADMPGATVVLFWFADGGTVARAMPALERLPDGCRVVTLWGPLPGRMPERVEFPFILNRAPFARAAGLREQLLAVFGVDCVDFATAWEHAERYTRAIELPGSQNDRFVTIIQALVIWISARNLGVACGDGIPEPISTYMGILENFYGIETRHLLG